MRSLLAALLLLGSSAAYAAPSAPAAAEEKEPFKLIHVADLAKALKQDAKPNVYDVNGPETRSKWGVIPGAKLLSSCCRYDAYNELPPDKQSPLVFYCANTH